MKINGCIITKDFSTNVAKRINSTQKKYAMLWLTTLLPDNKLKSVFDVPILNNFTYLLLDTEEKGIILWIVIKNRFVVVIPNKEGLNMNSQSFFLGTKMKSVFKQIQIKNKGMFISSILEKEIQKAIDDPDLMAQCNKSVLVEHCMEEKKEVEITSSYQLSEPYIHAYLDTFQNLLGYDFSTKKGLQELVESLCAGAKYKDPKICEKVLASKEACDKLDALGSEVKNLSKERESFNEAVRKFGHAYSTLTKEINKLLL